MCVSDIEASLSLGIILNKKQSLFLSLGIAICLILPVVTFMLVIIPEVIWNILLIVTLFFANLLCLSLFGILVYIKLKNIKIKKKISAWLDDAIELIAFCKIIGENRLGIQPKATKVKVEFKFDNINHIKFSTAKVFGGQTGYLGTFNKYSNKVLRIAYSPRYDEVMILKDKQ